MNKYNNPRLTNTTIAGSGMKHPVRPHVIIGDPKNGYIQGDLMDANAVKQLFNELKELISKIIDTVSDLANSNTETQGADASISDV